MKLPERVTFDQVCALRQAGLELIARDKYVKFDFSQVMVCDSSALALLIAFKRAAQKRQVTLDFSGLPPSLLALAKLCNVRSIIQNIAARD